MKRNTKLEIIESAIKLKADNPLDNPSLQDIVTSIGISKAAVYRHFKNKQELDDEIDSVLNEDAARFFEIANQNPKDIAPILILLANYCVKKNHHMRVLFIKVMKNAVLRSKFCQLFTGKGYREDTIATIFMATLFGIHVEDLRITKKDVKENEIEKIVSHIITCLDNGILEFNDIDKNKIHKIFMNSIPKDEDIKEDKYLNALSDLIVKSGISSITIKNIALTLGQAESTLYSKFTTKEEMIRYTARKELKNLLLPLQKKMEEYDESSEKLIAMFSFISNYIALSPELTSYILLLCIPRNQEKEHFIVEDFYNMISCIPIQDIHVKYDSNIEHLKFWCFALAVVLGITTRQQTLKDRKDSIFSILDYIRNGIYTDNKENI